MVSLAKLLRIRQGIGAKYKKHGIRKISIVYSLFRLFWTVFNFSMFRDGIQSKFTRFIKGDRHWIVKRGDNVVKTYGICKNLSNPVPIPSFQKRHLFKIC
jgi:hypothetical protein